MAEYNNDISWFNSKEVVSIERSNTLYQRKYPIRLPKLAESPRKSTPTFFDEEREENPNIMMSKLAREYLFSKRDQPEKVNNQNIHNQMELLEIEDFLEEDELDEELKKFNVRPAASNKKKSKKSKLKDGSVSSPQHHVKRYLKGKRSPTPLNNSLIHESNNNKESNDIVAISPSKLNKNKIKRASFTEQFIGEDRRRIKSSKGCRSPLSHQGNKNHETLSIITQIKSKGESSVIRNLTRKIKTTQNHITFHSMIQNKNSQTPATEKITPKIKVKEAFKNSYFVKSKNGRALYGSLRTSKNKQKGSKVVKKIEAVQAELPMKEEVILTETKKKLSESEIFWNSMRDDCQVKLLEDRTSKLLIQRDQMEQLKGEPISYKVAKALRLLLFGSSLITFNGSWREQALVFNKPLHYGLKFYKDGPAGIMTSLQAFVMKYLLFINIDHNLVDLTERLKPDSDAQHRALHLSMCDMLWRAGEQQHAVVALPLGDCTFVSDTSYREDKVTEKLQIFKFTNSDELEKFFRWNLHLFQEMSSFGCIAFLYSLMLSRGLLRLHSDCMELTRGLLQTFEDNPLYRSQSLINLCIHGKAVPNVFNGEVEDEIENEIFVSKGINKRCEVGFLTHEEFMFPNRKSVGSCLKTPMYPIWVVNNDNRACVVFSLKRDLLNDWKLERRFDIYCYQGIPRYVGSAELDFKLTIDTILPLNVNEYEEDDNSTIEETLRTKWADAVIEWNGYKRF